jgi:hypothetical protein
MRGRSRGVKIEVRLPESAANDVAAVGFQPVAHHVLRFSLNTYTPRVSFAKPAAASNVHTKHACLTALPQAHIFSRHQCFAGSTTQSKNTSSTKQINVAASFLFDTFFFCIKEKVHPQAVVKSPFQSSQAIQ